VAVMVVSPALSVFAVPDKGLDRLAAAALLVF
jgi:hypothetical protein